MVKPFLRWTGGKSRLLPELRKHIPADFTRYVEPFLGGGAMFFDLDLEPSKMLGVYLGDANAALMNLYTALREATAAEVIERANSLIAEHNRAVSLGNAVAVGALYNDARLDGLGESAQARAARFLYLNRAAFNGLWRENKRGRMNTPLGSKTKPLRTWDPDLLLAAGNKLKGCDLVAGSYEWAIPQAVANTFVYLDPPYDVEPGATGFTAYTASKFNRDIQRDLAKLVHQAVHRGVKVLVSNAGTSLVRSLYTDGGIGTIHEVTCSRGWRTKEHGAHVPEVIIRCGY